MTPEFIADTYGICREGPYYKTDRSRAFFKMPVLPRVQEARGRNALRRDRQGIQQVVRDRRSTWAAASSDCRCLAKKNSDKYEFQPIVRTIVELEDTANYFRPPYAKFQLELAYNDETPVCKVSEKKDGVRTEVALNSVTEALQHIRYLCKHPLVINFSKLYAMKTSSGNAK